MLNHSCFNANAYNSAQLNPRTEQVWLCAAPMTHVGGRIALCVMPEVRDWSLWIASTWTSFSTYSTRERYRPFLPPTAIYTLLDHPSSTNTISSVKQLGYGSAPMNIERLKEAIQRLGPIMSGGYGQTECPMSFLRFGQINMWKTAKLSATSAFAVWDENTGFNGTHYGRRRRTRRP